MRVAALLAEGAMLYRGLGGGRDVAGAAQRYEAAAQLGSIEGWENLADVLAKSALCAPPPPHTHSFTPRSTLFTFLLRNISRAPFQQVATRRQRSLY